MLQNPQRSYRTLLRAGFTTPVAAPLPASLPVTVGGPLTVRDVPGTKQSISAGKHRISGTAVWGDETWHGPALPRTNGLAVLYRLDWTDALSTQMLGFRAGIVQVGTANDFADFNNTGVAVDVGGLGPRMVSGATTPLLFLPVIGTVYELLLIARPTAGRYLLIRAVGDTLWTVLWADTINTTATLYASATYNGVAGVLNTDDLKVIPLASFDSRFAGDFTFATFHDPAPASSMVIDQGAHTPDCILDWQFTFDSASTNSYGYRLIDNLTDKFTLRINAAGTMNLRSVVAGVTTTLLTVATPTAGNTVFQHGVSYNLKGVIVGNVHTWYVDNAQKIAYTDPANSLAGATGINTPAGSILTRMTHYPRTTVLRGVI